MMTLARNHALDYSVCLYVYVCVSLLAAYTIGNTDTTATTTILSSL